MKILTAIKRISAASALAAAIVISDRDAFAASDTWNVAGGTNQWTVPASWLSGTQYPNGSGDVASFTNDITSAQTVNITQAVTVGTINIGDSAAPTTTFTIGFSTQTINLDNGASGLTINNLAGGIAGVALGNIIRANLIATGANSNLTINVSGGTLGLGTSSLSPVLTVGSLTKTGAGELTLSGITSTVFIASPQIDIKGGSLVVAGGPTFRSNTVVTIYSGANLRAVYGETVAEIRGSGWFRDGQQPNSPFVVGNSAGVTYQGVTIATNGVLRPGDTTAIGQIGTLSIGIPSASATPVFQPGSKMYFDIESYTNFDKINAPRVFSIVNGGDVYLNFQGGFQPTNGAQFNLFIDDNTAGYQDPNGGMVFDHTFNTSTGLTNFFYIDDGFTTKLGGDPTKTSAGGPDSEDPTGLGFPFITFTYFIPEPSAMGLLFMSGAVLLLRRRRD